MDSKNNITNAWISPYRCLFYDTIILNNGIHISSTDIALKYYPSRSNSVGLVRKGFKHGIEALLEGIDGGLRYIIGRDDLIYDMHGLNARFYLRYRNSLCDE